MSTEKYNDTIKFLVEHLPTSPGVYLMEDKHGKIIYIGKAKNLKNRVSQYFTRPQIGKVAAMVRNVAKFSTIITNSDKEAFILELKLIQTHYPRYNILLKDDSHYPYIALTKKGDPIVTIERKSHRKDLYYFGPFPASAKAYQTVDLINKIFKTKKCKGHHKEPCFYYHLGQCLGYCFKDVSQEERDKVRSDVKAFLEGRDNQIVKFYESLMKEEAAVLNFEKANEYKTIIEAIKHVHGSQHIELKSKKNIDVFAFVSKEELIGLLIQSYRNGVLLSQHFETVNAFGEIEEQIVTLLGQYYTNNLIPDVLVLGNEIIAQGLHDFLETKIVIPKMGDFLVLLNRAYQNGNEALSKHLLFHQQLQSENSLLEELAKLLDIKYPHHIELVDIAHLSGSEAIGVVTTFINGRPFKKLYRKYNITSSNKFDDYNNMKEVLTRHYKRKLEDKSNLANLLVVDGGKGQLNIALEVKDNLNLDIDIAGLVKNDKHQTRALLTSNGEYEVSRPLLSLLASMQEEVHRFAITSHRNKRNKATYQSIFDGVKGLGKKRQALILKTYPSLDELKIIPLNELSQLIPEEVAKRLLEVLSAL